MRVCILLGSEKVTSPNGGNVTGRNRLTNRFSHLLATNDDFIRRTVSYQGNKDVPGFRWLRYKEGFSRDLVLKLVNQYSPTDVLDPFSGICTTPLVAASCGSYAMGIEIMPVGLVAAQAMVAVANEVNADQFDFASQKLLNYVCARRRHGSIFAFPHVGITEGAFTRSSESEIANAREFVYKAEHPGIRKILNLACMSVLEECSFTRKDGQYLRWDHRSGRTKTKIDLGHIPSFVHALSTRLDEISSDFEVVRNWFHGSQPDLVTGSSLEVLRKIEPERFDMVITSPPYANRYDYTRTYALELAWLGYDREAFTHLRQRMLTATVENKGKLNWLREIYGDKCDILTHAELMYRNSPIHEILAILRDSVHELSNKNVIRLIEGYFFEMAVIIAELGRVVRPNGLVVMVNDNVQYHGEEIPVDYLLADFAEQCGFGCSHIWVLPKGKGNSSQQMAKYGRNEMRKCVYVWERIGDGH